MEIGTSIFLPLRIIKTGNPVRQNFDNLKRSLRDEALSFSA